MPTDTEKQTQTYMLTIQITDGHTETEIEKAHRNTDTFTGHSQIDTQTGVKNGCE